jgi:hypothetical protein
LNKVLIYTFAIGRYLIYSELWQYCLRLAYPEYDVRVITWGNTVDNLPQYFGAVNRYLLTPPLEYDYYYITDIDMMIVREDPPLHVFHMEEMNQWNLCYSNRRRGPGQPVGVNRLTGLHFCSREWFSITAAAREKYTNIVLSGQRGNDKIDDELIIADIATESGLTLAPQGPLVTRHHGIHLGTVRDYRGQTLEKRRTAFKIRVKRDTAVKWQKVVETEEYQRIYSSIRVSDRDAAWELYEVDKLTKQMCNEGK